MQQFTLPMAWDALKFAARYHLDKDRDFYIDGEGKLVVFPVLPDNPPIFEVPDPTIPAPPGIWVHEMKALSKRIGNNLLDGLGTPCFHIVAETEAHLADPWLNGILIDVGSTAYLMDKSKTVVWDGTKWK